MSGWEEPDERARPLGFGGDWRGSRMTFNNPMSWSVPVVRIKGIVVRIHVFFLAFVLITLSKSASVFGGDSIGLVPTSIALAALFLVILTHEFGHCIACRMHGGTADEILMWPLGGLASCEPPRRAKAHLWTAIGGPLVNVAIIAVLTPWIGLVHGQWWGLAIPNPFDLGGIIRREEVVGWAHFILLVTNYIAWALLLFNLIPMFPLDGGRILQALCWKRMGYTRSMRFACRAGLIGAIVIGFGALMSESMMLLVIALFGGVTCFGSLKQLDQERDFLGFDPDPAELAAMEDELEEDDTPLRPPFVMPTFLPTSATAAKSGSKDASKDRGKDASKDGGTSESEIDRILAKIGSSGIDSLSAKERTALQRATDEKRGGSSPKKRTDDRRE